MFTQEFKDFFKNNKEQVKKKKYWGRYLYTVNFKMITSQVQSNAKVLAIGPWVSDLFKLINSSESVGIDPCFNSATPLPSSNIHIFSDFKYLDELNEKFDYIILSSSIGMMEDILDSFIKLRKFCKPETRIIATYYNRTWQPFIRFSELLGLRLKTPEMNWVPAWEIENLLYLADFQTIKRSIFCLIPIYIPFFSNFINRFISILPFINLASVLTLEVSRPLNLSKEKNITPKVSIVVPARNEAGNIKEIVRRLPNFPGGQEIIFVEGGSVDNTKEAIEKVIQDNHNLEIKFLTQKGKGKKNAVETGFNIAQGDIFIILDADLSVPPEALPKFYKALIEDKGEFINGSRMVYPMKGKAMKFLNMLANVFFSKNFSYLLDQRVRDTLCGTKVLMRNDYLHILKNKSYFGNFDYFGDFDLLFGAAHLNLKIIDMPVRYNERIYGQTNIKRWRDGFFLMKMMIVGAFKLKFSWLVSGKYANK